MDAFRTGRPADRSGLRAGHGRVAGLGVSLATLALVGALPVARPRYLDAVPANVISPPTAAAVFDAMVGQLWVGLLAVLALGLVVAAVAFLSGHRHLIGQLRR